MTPPGIEPRPGKASRVEVGGRRSRFPTSTRCCGRRRGPRRARCSTITPASPRSWCPHLAGRADHAEAVPGRRRRRFVFREELPVHRPPWIHTVTMGDVNYCLVDEPATVVWLANLAAIELHPTLATEAGPGLADHGRVRPRPRAAGRRPHVRPGGPADPRAFGPIAPGGVGQDVGQQGPPALCAAEQRGHVRPDGPVRQGGGAIARKTDTRTLVVSYQQRAAREGKVLIDWSQNTESKTTVAFTRCGRGREPTVSTPVTWDELDDALSAAEPDRLCFEWEEVLERVERRGPDGRRADPRAGTAATGRFLNTLRPVAASYRLLLRAADGVGGRAGGQDGVGRGPATPRLAHGPTAVSLKPATARSATGSTQRNEPDWPKWPKVCRRIGSPGPVGRLVAADLGPEAPVTGVLAAEAGQDAGQAGPSHRGGLLQRLRRSRG